jgi:hypothetical protein
MFAAGLVMAITTSALVFLAPYNPKELEFWPMVLLIFGIGLIAALGRVRKEEAANELRPKL